jgi:hypothetical protein
MAHSICLAKIVSCTGCLAYSKLLEVRSRRLMVVSYITRLGAPVYRCLTRWAPSGAETGGLFGPDTPKLFPDMVIEYEAGIPS